MTELAKGIEYPAPTPRASVVRSSSSLHVVGHRALLVDGQMAGLGEEFDEAQSFGFSDLMAKVRDQIAEELLFVPWSGGGGLA